MKNAKKSLFTLLAVMLVMCIALPSWAYKCTVTNEFSQDDGAAYVTVQYTPMQTYDFNGGYGVGPGQTLSYDNDDWKNKGACWSFFMVKPINTWAGCSAPKWTEKLESHCKDVKFIIRRSGCGVDIFIN